MCTKACPCLDYNNNGRESTADYKKNPAIMGLKNRSFDKMIFTKDNKTGF